MKSYNGHRSWNCWNIALWLSNEERTYLYISALLETKTKAVVARQLAKEFEGQTTPDGGKYNYTAIRAALVGWV